MKKYELPHFNIHAKYFIDLAKQQDRCSCSDDIIEIAGKKIDISPACLRHDLQYDYIQKNVSIFRHPIQYYILRREADKQLRMGIIAIGLKEHVDLVDLGNEYYIGVRIFNPIYRNVCRVHDWIERIWKSQ